MRESTRMTTGVMSELMNSMIKRKCSDMLYTKIFWKHVKEFMFMGIVRNIEKEISKTSFVY